MEKCRHSGINGNVGSMKTDIFSPITIFVKQKPSTDMVWLRPDIAGRGKFSSSELKKLSAAASKPILTVRRHAFANQPILQHSGGV